MVNVVAFGVADYFRIGERAITYSCGAIKQTVYLLNTIAIKEKRREGIKSAYTQRNEGNAFYDGREIKALEARQFRRVQYSI